MNYTAKTFNIPSLSGISDTTINEHLKLYQGYVNNVNKIQELVKNDSNQDSYAVKEALRRLGFEFGGMRNHEYYFAALEGGPRPINSDSAFAKKIDSEFGSFDIWLNRFKNLLATQRGVGWVMLGYDRSADNLINYWVDEQHIGQLASVTPLIALDMWEHAYCLDYPPSKKSDYVSAYLNNLNYSVIENSYNQLIN